MSKRLRYTALVILAVGFLVPAGLAAQDVVYTGCLKSADGSLYSVRAGTTPMAPCKAKDKQISWNMAGQPGPQGPPGPSLPPSLNIPVNCAEHQSINAALGQQAEDLTISISGTCVESVYIRRDDVTLQGVGTNPTITAPEGAEAAIVILGAQRVRLQGLALIGGGFAALHASEAAYFRGSQLKISNPTAFGLFMWGGAAAWITGSEISGCQADGVALDNGSSLYLEDCQVIDNEGAGLLVQASDLSLLGTNVARNRIGVAVRNSRVMMFPWGPANAACTVLDNDMWGVMLGFGQLFLDSCRIARNGSQNIAITDGSTAILDNVIIQEGVDSGVLVVGGSSVKVGGASTIDGGTSWPGIQLSDTSMASVPVEASITGSPYGIMCAPPPSVAQLAGPVSAIVTTNCPRPQ